MKVAKSKLQERQQKAAEQWKEVQDRLKAHKAPKREKPGKGLAADYFLDRYSPRNGLAVILRTYSIRPQSSWVAKSYNDNKNLESLVRHCLVKYPVPQKFFDEVMEFFFVNKKVDNLAPVQYFNRYRYVAADRAPAFNPPPDYGIKKLPPEYIGWFICMAQGKSLYKEYFSKYKFTKQETHDFCVHLKKHTVQEAMFLAKTKNNRFYFKYFAEHIVSAQYMNNSIFWNGFFNFVNNNPTFPEDSIREVKDYILAHVNDNFIWKGRTIQSMIQLTNRWHQDRIILSAAQQGKLEWRGVDIHDKEYIIHKGPTEEYHRKSWKFTQLLNGKSIANEGAKMKHCVASYLSRCVNGQSHIFSAEMFVFGSADSEHRFTIELNSSKNLVQARKKWNKALDHEDEEILRKWLGDHGLRDKRGKWG